MFELLEDGVSDDPPIQERVFEFPELRLRIGEHPLGNTLGGNVFRASELCVELMQVRKCLCRPR